MSEIPEHLLRYPTATAIDSLAQRFNLPNTAFMQDWEYEVADSNRIDEFLSSYQSGELSADECFVLMATLLQSFEEIHYSLEKDERWSKLLKLIEDNIELHICTVWYWSCLENNLEDSSHITPFMRPILSRNHSRFVDQNLE